MTGNGLNEWRDRVMDLVREKEYMNNNAWLVRLFRMEVDEFCEAAMRGTPKQAAAEFADVLQVLLNMMHNIAPGMDLDGAVRDKMEVNRARAPRHVAEVGA